MSETPVAAAPHPRQPTAQMLDLGLHVGPVGLRQLGIPMRRLGEPGLERQGRAPNEAPWAWTALSSALPAPSVSHVIRAYPQSATDYRNMRTWPDLRRITTCGQLVLLLYDSEELVKDEAEDLLAIVLRLVAELAAKCPMALDLEETLAQPMRLAAPQPALALFLYDYSVPPLSDDWSFDATFVSLVDGSYRWQ
ncbi:hypothetical protein EHS25_006965 [Saitozyma podzolica]|uniref:Uncharacterized protein n=1 Tax=Saitozyma podzolica TaxID=1890683 RepID=A0A427XPN4_9TREE|nr:hypothetical protein EHS25_006965 [Saitozyma podzolica]